MHNWNLSENKPEYKWANKLKPYTNQSKKKTGQKVQKE